MSKRLEPEVLAAELKAMGCPYSAGDPACQVWMAGYQAGVNAGYRGAAEAMGLKLPVKAPANA